MAPGEKINKRILEHVEVIQSSFADQETTLQDLAKKVASSFHQEGRLWLAGSGPMATTAHLVSNLFLYRMNLERPPLPAIALGQDAALAGSLSRDGKGHQVLSRQLRVMAGSRDVLLVFGAIGADPAIDEVMECAKQMQLLSAVVFPEGGQLATADADFSFALDTASLARAMEGSLFFGQLLCELVEGQLFGV